MGRKHVGARQLLYLCFAGVICFFFLGCSTPKVSKDIQVTEAVPATKTLPEGGADPVPEKEIRAVCPTPESQAAPALPPVSPLPLLSPLPPVSPQPPPAAVQTPTPPAGEEPPRFASPKVQRARKLLAQKDYEASLKLSEKVLAAVRQPGGGGRSPLQPGSYLRPPGKPQEGLRQSPRLFPKIAEGVPQEFPGGRSQSLGGGPSGKPESETGDRKNQRSGYRRR